jgi:hypothetical protein
MAMQKVKVALTTDDGRRSRVRTTAMKCAVVFLAAMLAVTTPASARNYMDWDCGDHVTVGIK